MTLRASGRLQKSFSYEIAWLSPENVQFKSKSWHVFEKND